MTRPLRVCIIASSRFPISEPFAGGLEAHTHAIATGLSARGHEVSLFAAPGSDQSLHVHELPVQRYDPSISAQRDVNAVPQAWMAEHHAYLSLMLGLFDGSLGTFDVVHNNSLHHLPIAMASVSPSPMVTTLHTPPTPWLESAILTDRHASRFVAVSASTAQSWSHALDCAVLPNGVDTRLWAAGDGGSGAVWTGRMVAEKAPHLAIDAARVAGVPLVLAGPVPDPRYFANEIRPRLGPDAVYLGHLTHHELVKVVGAADVALVTPEWDEPFGLVAVEALSCGTPVAAFARGGLRQIVTAQAGALAEPGNVDSLATAIRTAMAVPRSGARKYAVREYSVERMIDRYEALYREMAG